MLNCNRGHSSAHWRVRSMLLVLLIESFLFSVGTASSSSKENVDQKAVVDHSVTPVKFRSILNSYPALQVFEVHFTQKDSSFPKLVGSASHFKSGLLNVLKSFIAQFCSTAVSTGSLTVESLHDHNRQRMKVAALKGYEVPSSSSKSRRLLYTGPRYSKSVRPPSPIVYRAARLDKKQEIYNEGRRVLAQKTEGVTVTQQVLLGPPAPPDLVKNEKQDWNQDYEDPAVHPPSSN